MGNARYVLRGEENSQNIPFNICWYATLSSIYWGLYINTLPPNFVIMDL